MITAESLGMWRALLWCAMVFTLIGLVLTTVLCLLVSAWNRPTGASLFERASQTVATSPMQLAPLIEGNATASVGDLVYLTHVVLKPGPGPKVFFLAGARGVQILTVAEGAHVIAVPGDTVDVRGTIHSTPTVTTLRRQWKVSLADARRISENPIYIESDLIRESVHANVAREAKP